jgi:hypothetical protein
LIIIGKGVSGKEDATGVVKPPRPGGEPCAMRPQSTFAPGALQYHCENHTPLHWNC